MRNEEQTSINLGFIILIGFQKHGLYSNLSIQFTYNGGCIALYSVRETKINNYEIRHCFVNVKRYYYNQQAQCRTSTNKIER